MYDSRSHYLFQQRVLFHFLLGDTALSWQGFFSVQRDPYISGEHASSFRYLARGDHLSRDSIFQYLTNRTQSWWRLGFLQICSFSICLSVSLWTEKLLPRVDHLGREGEERKKEKAPQVVNKLKSRLIFSIKCMHNPTDPAISHDYHTRKAWGMLCILWEQFHLNFRLFC